MPMKLFLACTVECNEQLAAVVDNCILCFLHLQGPLCERELTMQLLEKAPMQQVIAFVAYYMSAWHACMAVLCQEGHIALHDGHSSSIATSTRLCVA